MKPAIIFIPLCKTKLIRVSSSPTVEKCITNCSKKKVQENERGLKNYVRNLEKTDIYVLDNA